MGAPELRLVLHQTQRIPRTCDLLHRTNGAIHQSLQSVIEIERKIETETVTETATEIVFATDVTIVPLILHDVLGLEVTLSRRCLTDPVDGRTAMFTSQKVDGTRMTRRRMTRRARLVRVVKDDCIQ